MFLLLHLIIFYNLVIWKPCSAYYAEDTNERMKGKIVKLATELVLDAGSKIASVQHLREEIHKDVPFQYGNIVYEMKHRHKKMFKIFTDVLHAMEVETGDEEQYVEAIAEVDSLAHEIFNFATMILIHDANMHLDKTRPGYDLFFRRSDVMAPVWLGLVDNLNNNPPEPSSPPPEQNNQTHTGKRKNGVWHYAVPVNND